MNIKVKDLILINDLIQVSTNTLDNRIKRYVIEVSKEDQALYVEAYQESGNFSVFLKKELDNVEKDENINIANADMLSNILKNIIDDENISISMTKEGVIIDKDNIKLATYEPSKDELETKEGLMTFFSNRDYGETDNNLILYEKDKEKPKYDAKCRIDLSILKAKKIRDVFSEGDISIKIEKGSFFFKVNGINSINRKIRSKGKTDETKITGNCLVHLSDLSCLAMLSKFKGFVNIELKQEFPMLIKKKLEDENIGINYVISIATKNS